MNNGTSKRQQQKKKKASKAKSKSGSSQEPRLELRQERLSEVGDGGQTLELLDSEYTKLRSLGLNIPPPVPLADSELAFGHNNDHLAHVDLEDEAFSSWYRKTAGMHTVRTWCENYQKHPYAWGALIMIHGVDEVSARLRSKVENYAVYSAVLLSASVVLLAMTEMNVKFSKLNNSGEAVDMVMARVYLYSLCVSVASHLTSILLSMSFVNSLNEAGRDSDVIRMFGEVRWKKRLP